MVHSVRPSVRGTCPPLGHGIGDSADEQRRDNRPDRTGTWHPPIGLVVEPYAGFGRNVVHVRSVQAIAELIAQIVQGVGEDIAFFSKFVRKERDPQIGINLSCAFCGRRLRYDCGPDCWLRPGPYRYRVDIPCADPD